MAVGRWQEQWARVQRLYDRLNQLSVGKPAPVDAEAELDDTYSFFLHCYHLKDWLKNDPSSGKTAQEIESLVTKIPDLALCADIANSVKHLTLNRPPRSGALPGTLVPPRFDTKAMETFAFDGEEKFFTSSIIYIEHAGALLPVVRIAQRAVMAWRRFVT